MAANDNPPVKSINELLVLFMRQAAIDAQRRRAMAAQIPARPPRERVVGERRNPKE